MSINQKQITCQSQNIKLENIKLLESSQHTMVIVDIDEYFNNTAYDSDESSLDMLCHSDDDDDIWELGSVTSIDTYEVELTEQNRYFPDYDNVPNSIMWKEAHGHWVKLRLVVTNQLIQIKLNKGLYEQTISIRYMDLRQLKSIIRKVVDIEEPVRIVLLSNGFALRKHILKGNHEGEMRVRIGHLCDSTTTTEMIELNVNDQFRLLELLNLVKIKK